MPSSDTLTLVVATGLGVSVVAGIFSGIVYVLSHGLPSRRNRKPTAQWHCAICSTYLRSIEGILEEKVVTCSTCQRRICKFRCSKINPKNKEQWICRNCFKNASWFQGILNAIPPKYHNLIARYRLRMAKNERFDEIDEDIEAIRQKEKGHVRDFIERLVTAMLGGNVDDASITRIYNDEQYDALFDRYHQDLTNALIDLGSALHISIANLPVSGQSPCTAHATLKQLIEKVLREALNLPSLERVEDHPAIPSDESGRTYEDLLATAILNKVVSSCQNNLPSSSAASVSSRFSSSSTRPNDNREYFFGEETLETKWKHAPDTETTSISSLEEWIQSDSSMGSLKYVDRVSLTIQQKIEEAAGSESDNEEDGADYQDDTEYFRSTNLLQNDDSNWYLQKRQFQGTHSPVPVPMLVPNPVIDAKVLIGDKQVEDTSDLSDAASDYDDSEMIQSSGTIGFLVESKMVIGGKNAVTSLPAGSDAESSADSGVKDDRDEDYSAYTEEQPKTDATVDDENVEDESLLSMCSNTEKDTEYTERYASLPRTIEKSPSSIPKGSEIVEEEPLTHEFEGFYSKKEKEKWKNPVEMKNNPYTAENIERRMKAKSGKFGRDYYLKQASNPSGTKKKSEEEDEDRVFTSLHDADGLIVRAEPTFIGEDDLGEITSDSDLSYVNCYDVQRSTAFRKSSDGDDEEITVNVNTKGLYYHSKDPDSGEEADDIVLELNSYGRVDSINNDNNCVVKLNTQGLPHDPPPPRGQTKEPVRLVNEDPSPQEPITIIKVNNEDLLRDAPPQEQKREAITIIKLNKEGLLYDPPLLEVKGESKLNKEELCHHSSHQEQTKDPIKIIKLNKEGLLYNPPFQKQRKEPIKVLKLNEEGLHSATSQKPKSQLDNNIITFNENELLYDSNDEKGRDENFNVPQSEKVEIPQVKPRHFVGAHTGGRPVASIRNKIADNNNNSSSFDASPTIVKRKADNSFIKMIYNDPVVRNFALTYREQIPVDVTSPKAPFTRQDSSTPISQFAPSRKDQFFNMSLIDGPALIMDSDVSDDFLAKSFTDDSDTEPHHHRKISSQLTDPEINKLKEKRVVASRLGEFSKSFPNLSRTQGDIDNQDVESFENVIEDKHRTVLHFSLAETEEQSLISVKDLKKRFEIRDALAQKGKFVHSLTARSISKPMREQLRTEGVDGTLGEVDSVTIDREKALKFYESLNRNK